MYKSCAQASKMERVSIRASWKNPLAHRTLTAPSDVTAFAKKKYER